MKEINELYLRLCKIVINIEDHVLQVAYVSKLIAEKLGYDKRIINMVGLFHDLGFSAPEFVNQVQKKKSIEKATVKDWLVIDKRNGKEHASKGALLSNFLPFLSDYEDVIFSHHSSAEELKESNISHYFANMICLADTVSISFLTSEDINYSFIKNVRSNIENSTLFFDTLKKAFLEISRHEEFWWSLENRKLLKDELLGDTEDRLISLKELDAFANLVTFLVDTKSSFTRYHTQRIVHVSKKLAESFFLGKERIYEMQIAAKFHDIGKMATPISILNKPGSLDEGELYIMKKHVYDSYLILGGQEAVEKHKWVRWAVEHHERLDGSGYPWGRSSDELSLESRILMVADVFVALTEDRPYRKGLSVSKSLEILEKQVDDGLMPEEVVNKLRHLVNKGFRHDSFNDTTEIIKKTLERAL
jgi:putative nucleotidyltransferase with HDIG domain